MSNLFVVFFFLFIIKEVQRQFNKRVKYEVNKKFGSFYLADHQVRELDVKEMHRIRSLLYIFLIKLLIIIIKNYLINKRK